ncbi:MAG TPA: response regulator [Chitinophagaceae bacterium]|nr:response regulator [Chitinophagaceae bacterium]
MTYRRIMLIDDDEDDKDIFCSALEKVTDKISLTAFDNAREALNKLSSKEIHADLIFLDLNMPVMNGQQFLVEIKKDEKLRHIPIIILSTSSHASTISLTRELGANDFITKPDKFDDLINILKKVLQP